MEKWQNGGSPNPLGYGPRPVKKKVIKQARPMSKQGYKKRPSNGRNLALARFGAPIQLFKDSDKDGVANVFDCKPYNKKKQDVIAPSNFGGGMRDMYNRREGSRQTRVYFRQMREAQRLEMERLKELARINKLPTIIERRTTTKNIYTDRIVDPITGKLVDSSSPEGKKITANIVKSTSNNKSVSSSPSDSFMESLGYVGQSTATGTKWTKAPVSNPFSGGGSSSSRSSGSSSSSSGSSSSSNKSSGSSSSGSSNFAKIIAPKPSPFSNNRTSSSYRAPAPAPKQSVVKKVTSWFRRRF